MIIISKKTIVVGCDTNNGNDAQWQNTIAKTLEQSGYNVIKTPIGPNGYASYSYSSKAKGKIGLYNMAASLISFLDGANNNFDYNYFVIRSDASRTIKSMNSFNKTGIPRDHHGDCQISACFKHQGKTYPQLNAVYSSRCKALFGKNPQDAANAVIQELGGTPSQQSSEQSEESVSPLLQGDMTFEELAGEICKGIDLSFLTKRTTVVVDDFSSMYAQAKYLRSINSKAIKGEDIKLWQMEEDSYELEISHYGFYNTVYVNYNGGTVKETYDDFVRVYGEVEITYDDPKIDKATAQMKAKAYLAAHIRDFGMAVRLTALDNGGFDVGDIITVENPLTFTNKNKILNHLDPEYLFINGISKSWEGDTYLSADLELGFAPVSPNTPELPVSGTYSGKSKNSDSSKAGIKFDSCGVSEDKKYVLGICQPSAGRKEGYSYNTIYETIFKNKCPRCGKPLLRWDSGRSDAKCITCGGYHGSKRTWGNISEGEISCNGCCSDFCGVTGWEKDGKYSSRLEIYQKPKKSSKKKSLELSKGNFSQ